MPGELTSQIRDIKIKKEINRIAGIISRLNYTGKVEDGLDYSKGIIKSAYRTLKEGNATGLETAMCTAFLAERLYLKPDLVTVYAKEKMYSNQDLTLYIGQSAFYFYDNEIKKILSESKSP